MELLDAMEAMEQRAAVATRATPADYLEKQVYTVQSKLREAWRVRHSGEAAVVPYDWAISKLLRLLEAYPDGVTEAVVLTELTAWLNDRVYRGDADNALGGSRIQDADALSEFLSGMESDALSGRAIGVHRQRLRIEVDQAGKLAVDMYLHQRFRSCIEFLRQQAASTPQSSFPFQQGRSVSFANAKLLERREAADKRSGSAEQEHFTLLPTPYLVVNLTENEAADQQFIVNALDLPRLDKMVFEARDSPMLQHLSVKAKVLDIGAIRACKTPMHVQRQVVLLGEETYDTGGSNASHWHAQASHMMVLWDDQVALSRLFHVGDTIILFYPFVHVCDATDTELFHIFSEYSSQQNCQYYFEYGTATVIFSSPSVQSVKPELTAKGHFGASTAYRDREEPVAALSDIRPGWTEFALAALVLNVKVSHGVPLLAAYFHSYYDPKTKQGAGGKQAAPTLDRAIVSKYYLVTIVYLYLPGSNQVLAVEVTGSSAQTALQALVGQTIFLDGLVAVDLQDEGLRGLRHRLLSNSQAEAVLAFADDEYAGSSSTVALCSDWTNIFGNQSMFRRDGRLTVVNTIPAILKTRMGPESSAGLQSYRTSTAVGMQLATMYITSVGWLVPSTISEDVAFVRDETCERGFSTMCAHRACYRKLVVVAAPPTQAVRPNPRSGNERAPQTKWRCDFCGEIFSGMDDTVQSYCEAVLVLEDTSTATSAPVAAVCQGNTVESLLGLPAEEYAQLRLTEKRAALAQAVGRDYLVVLSRCPPRAVTSAAPGEPREATNVDVRVDQIQPVHAYASARQLLASLQNH